MDIGEKLSAASTFPNESPAYCNTGCKPQPSGSASARRQQRDCSPPRPGGVAAVRGRLRAARGDLLGHAAPARQQLPRARAEGPAARAALQARDGARRAHAAEAGQLCLASHHPARGREVDAKKRPYIIIDPRGGHGPGIGGFKDDCRWAPRCARTPGLLRHVLPRSGTRADAARRVRGGARVRAQGARAASGELQARHRRQLPGRLGGDDARRLGARGDRAARDRRRADVLLGRRMA